MSPMVFVLLLTTCIPHHCVRTVEHALYWDTQSACEDFAAANYHKGYVSCVSMQRRDLPGASRRAES